MEVHGPVERGVATAHDENALAAEDPGIEHAIVQALVVPAVGVFERELAGRERTNATGDQHRPARILILIGEDGEERLAVLLAAPEADDLFAEMDRRLPLQALFREGLHQVL